MGKGKYYTAKAQKSPEPQDFRGAPFFLDSILMWFLKSLVQIPLFFLMFIIYRVYFFTTNLDPIMFFFQELMVIMVLLFISDFIATFCWAKPWTTWLIHRWGYLINPKRRETRLLLLTDYLFYLTYRAIAYLFGFLWVLTALLYPTCGWMAFPLAWAIISLTTRLLSFGSASLFINRF